MRLLPKDSEHGWTPYIWLIYVGPYLFFPFVISETVLAPALSWLAWVTGLIAFLILYFRSYWVDGARRVPLIVAMAALAAVLSPVNPGALMFFVYAGGFVGGAIKAAHAGYWIGSITAAGVLSALVSPWEPRWMLAGVAVMTPIIGFANLHYSETRRRDASLRLAQDEIARLATIAERERIAGDLHDLLGHTLSVIVLKSQLASKLVERADARAGAEIAEIERVARDALAEVRRAVHGFRRATLRDELTRARAVLHTAGITARIEESAIGTLPRDVEHAAAMILREAVTNVVRHSQAAECDIDVQQANGHLVVRVADDGVGGTAGEGSGIESMRARARDIGGTFEHRSRSEGATRGVSVTLRAPLGPLA